MTTTKVEIGTEDGTCPATLYGEADAPSVLMYIDGIGMRPSMHRIAERIARGYCMGGRMAIVAAATYPERIVAAAAYHPGGLVTDDDDSPHRLASKIRARLYLGRAAEDSSFSDEHEAVLEKALTDARVDHVIERYTARHGWVPEDTPAHDPAAAARHDETLLALLAQTLRPGRDA